MTSQVVLLNSRGVALATDSAVSISSGNRQVVRHTVCKLVEMPPPHCIAVMISSNANFMSYPNELLLREWAATLPPEPLEQFADYGQSFVSWLRAGGCGFDDSAMTQQFMVRNCVEWLVWDLSVFLEDVDDAVRLDATRGWVDVLTEHFNERPALIVADSDHMLRVDALIPNAVTQLIDRAQTRLSADLSSVQGRLTPLLTSVALAGGGPSQTTLAFAGYGTSDPLPWCGLVDLHGWCAGAPLVQIHEPIGGAQTLHEGLINTLAQDEEMHLFLAGYPVWIPDVCHSAVRSALDGQLADVTGALGSLDAERLTMTVSESVENAIRWSSQRNYVNPLLATLRGLALGELASVAHSLVSLECLRKLMAGEPATVGGPVDVAVITRHRGFEWVRQKDPLSASI